MDTIFGPDDTEYPTAQIYMSTMRWSCGLERLAREAVQGCPSKIPENPLYASNVLFLSNEQRKLYDELELESPLKMRFDDFASGRSRYQWGNMVLKFPGPRRIEVACKYLSCGNTFRRLLSADLQRQSHRRVFL
ncbi:hypothetical protein OSTOST_16556 [Ostertagia ostertagi]